MEYIIEIKAEIKENGEMEVTTHMEGNPIMLGRILSETINDMEGSDMDQIYDSFIMAQAESLGLIGEEDGK